MPGSVIEARNTPFGERKVRVLVLEGEESEQGKILTLLERHGLRGLALPSVEAIECPLESLADVVLFHPSQNGRISLQALPHLRAKESTFVPIILIASKEERNMRIEGLQVGADECVTMPIDEEELIARLQAMLRIKDKFDSLARSRDRFVELALQDELTGLYNVRYFRQRLSEEWHRAERHKEPLSVAFIDVDRFKEVNDRFGHVTGDCVLREVAKRLRNALRISDVVVRYGGEEFVVLLPHTSLAGAASAAERLRQAVASQAIETEKGPLSLTVSIGIALYPSPCVASKEDLIEAADQALYKAKEAGRNCICIKHTGDFILQSPRKSAEY
ncbi:MAG: diguanylate cyclase [Sandaracinaceae bacterium]|nr:diguanylate cyclase [Sandaracinaceae bacterium]